MAVLPVYEMRGEINTAEGWNKHRQEMAQLHLRPLLGREPTEREITAEMARNVAEGERILRESGICTDETPALPIRYFARDGRELTAGQAAALVEKGGAL